MNKNNLVFLVNSNNQNDIMTGGYVSSFIKSNGKDKISMNDDKVFLFTFVNNVAMKYYIKEDKKNEPVFYLYENWNEILFSFGNAEIIVSKRLYMLTEMNENPIFEYNNVDIPQINHYDRRLVVIQMKEQIQQSKNNELNMIEFKEKLLEKKPDIIKTTFDIFKEIIHQWTKMKYKETIFDSLKDNWKKGESSFN